MPKLYYFRGKKPNFGDELNPWLWPRLIPGFLHDDDDDLFLGIGTLLNDGVPNAPRKIVFGSGYGYGNPPRVDARDWRFLCVRGPVTAKMLGLPEDLAICDPAILLRRLPWPNEPKQFPVSFMPHWESLDRGNWPVACALSGIHFIDPTAPIEQVISDIRASELIISEAMHGAIVADAMRVPWIAVQPQLHMHAPKWLDWCASIQLSHDPETLSSSGYAESITAGYRRLRKKLGRHAHMQHALHTRDKTAISSESAPSLYGVIPNGRERRQYLLKFSGWFLEQPAAALARTLPTPISKILDTPFIQAAARDLLRISRARPKLSADSLIESLTSRLDEKLNSLSHY
jgi:succinoglycan biosynthesis protein ExoV